MSDNYRDWLTALMNEMTPCVLGTTLTPEAFCGVLRFLYLGDYGCVETGQFLVKVFPISPHHGGIILPLLIKRILESNPPGTASRPGSDWLSPNATA